MLDYKKALAKSLEGTNEDQKYVGVNLDAWRLCLENASVPEKDADKKTLDELKYGAGRASGDHVGVRLDQAKMVFSLLA